MSEPLRHGDSSKDRSLATYVSERTLAVEGPSNCQRCLQAAVQFRDHWPYCGVQKGVPLASFHRFTPEQLVN